MHRGIVTCDPSATVPEAVAGLAERGIHAVVVADAGSDEGDKRMWGFVSDLDLVRGLYSPIELRAGNLAALEVLTVSPDDALEQAARLMGEHDVAHLIVLEDGDPVGVLSTLDIARSVSGTVKASS
jgi:CBS domain-containing protein